MNEDPLTDTLGPRARRRVRVATVIAALVIAVLVALALRRLAIAGELDYERWRLLLEPSVLGFLSIGLLNTAKAATLAMILAMLVGGVAAFGRLSRFPVLRWTATAYVQCFRALPTLLLILFCFFGLPQLGVDVSRLWALVIAITVYNGAVLAEIFRAGIVSLERSQSEAAYAVGLTHSQTMVHVILPQALRRMLPAIITQLVVLFKDTSLGFFIGYEEFLRRGQQLGEFEGNLIQSYSFVALVYVLISLALSYVAQRLRSSQRRQGRGPQSTDDALEADHVTR